MGNVLLELACNFIVQSMFTLQTYQRWLRVCSVKVFSGIVVGVHRTTELAGGNDARSHELVGRIVGHIKLEEAGVSLREGSSRHVVHETHLMPVVEATTVQG